jgi:multiple sugar transport system permease protein/putative chitobiose transport system permease protein
MVLVALVLLLPLYWALLSSIRPQEAVFQFMRPVGWRTFIPTEVTFQYFVEVFTRTAFPRALLNSLFISATTVVAGTLLNSMAGFGFAKFEFRGRRLFFLIVLITFMMPFESLVIPLYLLIRQLGWIDTFLALIVPSIPNGLVIFLFRQFFAEFPDEMLEAARLDGAGWATIYRLVVLPLSGPVLVSAALILFLTQWDAFFWPLVVTNSAKHAVVQVEISRFIMQESTSWGRLFASAATAVTVPLVLFFSFQRYFIQGIAGTGTRYY